MFDAYLDVSLALTIMFSLELGVMRAMWGISAHWKLWQQEVVATVIVLLLLVYLGFLWDKTWWAVWLPYSSLIVYANWFPVFFLALAAIVAHMYELHIARRVVLVCLVLSAGTYSAVYPFLGKAPQCGNQWTMQGDCVQTTHYTCSAASAATLLHAYGIRATEQEMSELCLTRQGTSWMGLYRGLKLKTANTLWDVEIVECSPYELQQFARHPMIIDVGLSQNTSADLHFQQEHGWQPGQRHSVLLLSYKKAGYFTIYDPMPNIGREEWNYATLNHLWRGRAIRLVERWPLKRTTMLAAAK
jgi:hypothetical protein